MADNAWSSLAVSAPVAAAITGLGFAAMTPVQAAVIPLLLGNHDVAVEACTGSGKTLAFVIPVVERILRLDTPPARHHVAALLIAPTRELARQTHDVVSRFTADTSVSSVLLTGGTDVAADIEHCIHGGCNIIIATPGRLLDIMRRTNAARTAGDPQRIEFSTLEVLVLDEADTLLDMGFTDALTEILSCLPKQRRTGLFSATQTTEVKALARAGLRNPAVISVKVQLAAGGAGGAGGAGEGSTLTQSTPTSLTNYFMRCASPVDKLAQLAAFLRSRAAGGTKCIVFMLTCASVDYYGSVFSSPAVRAAAGLPPAADFPIAPLHGQLAPKKRVANYETFVAASSGALLCTDVAARGIDVPDVEWIVQFDPPKEPASYIHRVGRTARAGRTGQSLLLLLPKEETFVDLLAVKHVPITARARQPHPLAPDAGAAAAARAPLLDADDTDAGPYGGERLADALRAEALADRAVLEMGTRAFISFLRGYTEHTCKYIFKVEALPIPSLASSFGLVKLPKLDELRGKKIVYAGVPGVDTSAIAFKDAAREAQRQANLAANADKITADIAARDERRKKAIEAAEKAAAGIAAKRKRTHKGLASRLAEDWAVLAREEALEKRLREGRISKAEYKAEMAKLNYELGMENDDGLAAIAAAKAEAAAVAAGAATGAGDEEAEAEAAAAAEVEGGAPKAKRARKEEATLRSGTPSTVSAPIAAPLPLAGAGAGSQPLPPSSAAAAAASAAGGKATGRKTARVAEDDEDDWAAALSSLTGAPGHKKQHSKADARSARFRAAHARGAPSSTAAVLAGEAGGSGSGDMVTRLSAALPSAATKSKRS